MLEPAIELEQKGHQADNRRQVEEGKLIIKRPQPEPVGQQRLASPYQQTKHPENIGEDQTCRDKFDK